LALLVGQMLVTLDLLPAVTFPLFHVLAIALPALAMLILVGQGLRGSLHAPTQRQVIGQMAVGAFATTSLAFSLEVLMLVVGVVVLVVAVALSPGGVAQLAELQAILEDPSQLQDTQVLAGWLLKPGILLSLVVMLVVVAPLIEEGVKSIGVPLLSLWRRAAPSPTQGWLWGMAIGSGFAIAEGLFNSAASWPFWAAIALLRIGATAMHISTAGVTGLGWAWTLIRRRPWPVLAAYLASVALHGLWNGLSVLMLVSSLWMMAEPGAAGPMAAAGLGVVVGLIGLLFLTLGIFAVAAYTTWWLRRN
jgi:RsiW-degrading membrane proteinase PrsW (M82 family)